MIYFFHRLRKYSLYKKSDSLKVAFLFILLFQNIILATYSIFPMQLQLEGEAFLVRFFIVAPLSCPAFKKAVTSGL